jgi:GTP-binding protein
MKSPSASFVKSALRPEDFPRDGRPEIAFAGRSNVGKSSLLNRLLKRKGLAKTSKSPGKTRTINFFDVNGKLYFVDLPGYGYAKAPKAMQATWAKVLTGYLAGRESLRLVAALLDARHKPTQRDLDLLELLGEAGLPTVIVATKVDKLKRAERTRALRVLRETLDLDEESLLIPFSAVTGEGCRELWQVIEEFQ